MSLHFWTRSAGKLFSLHSVLVSSAMSAPANPLHIEGRYSFNGAVLNWPSWPCPTDAPLGRCAASLCLRSMTSMSGIPRTSSVVGFAEGAPNKPWAKWTSRRFGNARIIRRMGSLQILTISSCSGSLGCSTNPVPDRTANATIQMKGKAQ